MGLGLCHASGIRRQANDSRDTLPDFGLRTTARPGRPEKVGQATRIQRLGMPFVGNFTAPSGKNLTLLIIDMLNGPALAGNDIERAVCGQASRWWRLPRGVLIRRNRSGKPVAVGPDHGPAGRGPRQEGVWSP